MRGPFVLDRRLTVGVLVTLGLQFVAVLTWLGGAAQRLGELERAAIENRSDHVKIARVETRLGSIQRQLDRIEARLEPRP
ncbi:MAG: hypothetical protein AAFQ18_09065 [Pseudomonadota bacterium]